MASVGEPSCANCQKTEEELSAPLKRCAKCQTTTYCSRDCQKGHWKIHKKSCASNAAANASGSTGTSSETPSKVLEKNVDKPFHKLDARTWLHDRPEKDVYKLLIDSYRLSLEDDFKFEGVRDSNTLYGGAADSLKGFHSFLNLAQMQQTILPSWWSEDKAKVCEAFGMEQNNWHSLRKKATKADLVKRYGDQLIPMQMRMFREHVTGRSPMGHDSTMVRKFHMLRESGDLSEDVVFENMDMSGFIP